MVFIRLADQRALMLQRQGRFGTYAPCWGQEACQVGSASMLRERGLDLPGLQGIGGYPDHGDSLEDVLSLLDGKRDGKPGAGGDQRHACFDSCGDPAPSRRRRCDGRRR